MWVGGHCHVWLWPRTVLRVHQYLAWDTQPTPKAVYHGFVSVQPLGSQPTPVLCTGVYVQEMADAGTAKLYAGLLGVGDEILQVNGAAVSGLGLARIRELLLQADTLSLRVLRHRPAPR